MFANWVCKLGFQIRFANQVCKLGLQIWFANWVCKLGLQIRLQIRFANQVYKLGLQIRFANQVCKLGLQIGFANQVANQVCKLREIDLYFYYLCAVSVQRTSFVVKYINYFSFYLLGEIFSTQMVENILQQQQQF